MFTSPTGRLQPLWSFLLSVALSLAAFIGCSFLAALSSGEHVLRFEAVFRPLLSIALFGLYFWLLTVADHVEEHRLPALGFPLASGWRGQFAGGCLLGLVLTVLAVVPLAIWAEISFENRLSSRGILRVAVVILVLIFGALAEEMMFRGYPFQRLEEAIGPAGAIAVFSAAVRPDASLESWRERAGAGQYGSHRHCAGDRIFAHSVRSGFRGEFTSAGTSAWGYFLVFRSAGCDCSTW